MSERSIQTKINFYTNILALISNIVVGIYYTPYLLDSLGLAAYGVLPLALIVNQYISVAAQTLTHAYTRFYSVALQKGNYIEASKDISTSLIVVLIICFFLTPVSIWVVNSIDVLFQIPPQLLSNAKELFIYTLLSLVVSLFSSLLNVTLYALNRLDLMNYLKVIRVSFKFLFTLMFFELLSVDIMFVGLTSFLTEILIFIISIFLFFRYKPNDVRISFYLFDKKILYSILGMSIWVLIQLCGDTVLYRTDNLLVNHYWGAVSSGALGAISELGNYVSVIVSVLGSLFGPLILISYAKNNHNEVVNLFAVQSTIVGCISAVMTGILSGYGIMVLDIWLGNDMGTYNWWLIMKLIVLPFYASGGIMAFVYRSWNRVKLPALGTILLGFIDIVFLIFILEVFHPQNVMIVLVISSVFSFLQCYVLNAYAVSLIYPECKRICFVVSVKIILSFIICYLTATFVSNFYIPSNLIDLGLVLFLMGVLMFMVVFFFIFNKNERLNLINVIK